LGHFPVLSLYKKEFEIDVQFRAKTYSIHGDDPGHARFFKKKMEKHGYEVDIAPDGEKGLSMYEEGGHSLVVIDKFIPVHNGLELIQTGYCANEMQN